VTSPANRTFSTGVGKTSDSCPCRESTPTTRSTRRIATLVSSSSMTARAAPIRLCGTNWRGSTKPTKMRRGDKENAFITGYAVGHKTFTDRSIGVGFLRKDGFVSRDAGPEAGLLKTPLAALPGEGLTVNAIVRGELKVRLVDRKGKALPGFDWQDCIPVRGDSVAHRIGWRGEPALPTSEPVSLEFSLHDGEQG